MPTNYDTKHMGQSCIICGAAPSLLSEYEEAKHHRPDAVVICVNETVQAIHADHLITLHYNKMRYFKNMSINKNVVAHSAKPPRDKGDEIYFNDVDHVWPNANTSGTSGVAAIMVAEAMGFDEIILCGMPLEPTGYFNEGQTVKSSKTQPRFGYLKNADTLTSYHQNGFHKALNDVPRIKEITRSMGGYTKQILGGPQWQQI